jgi:hypothetical protein
MRIVPTGSRRQLYRCYIVWNASIPVIILPIILYIADIGMPPHYPQRRATLNAILAPPSATGIWSTYTLSRVGRNIVFNEKQERITNSFFGCTLALNAVCTGASYIAFADGEGKVFDIFPPVCSLLVRAYRVPHLADPEADA